jgi:hypothetical protein
MFVALWALASLTWPLGLDQGIFAWVGDAILRGGVPYRDAWEIKGPATHYLYALAQLLFGRDAWGLRVLDLSLLVASAAAAYALIARCGPRGRAPAAGALAALLWVLLYATAGYWHAAQPDGWAAMAWLGAAWAVARPHATPAHWLLAGALCGLSALLKPPFALFLAPLLLDRIARGDLAVALRAAPAALGGLLGVLALALLGFATAGALGDFVEVQLVFNPSLHPTAYRDLGPAELALTWLRWLAQPWAAAAFVAFAGGLIASWQTARADALLVASWAVLAAGLVTVQNQYFHYHFWPLLSAFALGAGLLARRTTQLGSSGARNALAAALALLLALAAWQPLWQIRAATAALPGADPERYERYRNAFGMGSYGYAAMERIAAHIQTRTKPADPILVWGFESGLYFLADRPASTRLGFLYPLVRGGGTDLEKRYLAEFTASLAETPPQYVVVFAQAYDEKSLPAENRAALGALWSLLTRCYSPDEELAGERIQAWQRRPGPCT